MTDIAIVGMGCRFAGAPDLHAYWDLTVRGADAFSEVPLDRWDNRAVYSDSRRQADKSYVRHGAFIDDIRSFPALALGIPPRRVEVMDPQHRIAIEVALAAIEDTGRAPSEMPRRTGVFIGTTSTEFRVMQSLRIMTQLLATGAFGDVPEDPSAFAAAVKNLVPPRPYSASGLLANMAAASVAQELDLHGPAYTVDAACASAVVAVVDAVDKLRSGTLDAAVAGGAYLCSTPEHYVAFSRLGAISEQGRCLPFDSRADGFVQGDGAGVLVLKRLDDAVRDGDRVYAVIKGVAANNDGRGDGPMAPVLAGQVEVMRQAWDDAAIAPGSVRYIEAHGTGTSVGDVIELGGLRQVFGEDTPAYIGSSKANVGHTMSAAGVAGLIRAALAIHHGVVPPMAGFEQPKEELDIGGTAFGIPTAPVPWETDERVACVSSFGFGGTNTHAVLSAAPHTAITDAQPELVLMSASDEGALRDLARRTADAIEADPKVDVAGVARAWAVRPKQAARLAIVASDRGELIARLRMSAGDAPPKGGMVYRDTAQGAPRVAFMFPGQGSQRLGMLSGLRDRFPQVAGALERLEGELDGLLPVPLTHLLYPERREVEVSEAVAAAELTATENCQPALLACGVALAELLDAVGVRPHVVTGHSLGEFTASAVAGVLSPSEAARFVGRRGAAMAALEGDPGAMCALMVDAETARGLLVDGSILANFNHPRQVVVSGTTPAIDAVMARAEAADVRAVRLDVSHGFHGPALDGLDVTPLVDALEVHDPQVTVASAIADHPYADGAEARAVFRRHATSPVDFVGALRQCREAGADLYLQVGAGGPLASFARGGLPKGSRRSVIPLASLDDAEGPTSLLDALAQLWVRGVDLDVRPITARCAPASVPPTVLPRESYWPLKEKAQRALKVETLAPAQHTADAPPTAVAPEPTPAEADPILDGVLAVVAKVSAYPRTSLSASMSLVEDLGFDSLMVGDLATGLAEAFPGMGGIPQELLINRPTVQDLIDHVAGAGRAAEAVDDDAPLTGYAPGWRAAPLPGDLPLRGAAAGPVMVVGAGPRAEAIAAAMGVSVSRADQAVAAPRLGALVWVAWDADPISPASVLAGERRAPDPSAPLLAALSAQASQGASPDLIVVVHPTDPWAGALAGVARAMAREWSSAVCKLVRVDAALSAQAAATAVVAERHSADVTPDVRLSASGREVPQLEQVELETELSLGEGDAVLITGGTRGIGAKLAHRLADAGVRVVVTGRRPPSGESRALWGDHIERITPVAVDATDRAALMEAIAPLRPFAAVVHCAGVLADGPVDQVPSRDGSLARHVKMDGWLNAIAASAAPVAVAIGSWAGRFGNRHQAHYGAANAAIADLASALSVRAAVAEYGPWTDSEMVRTIPAVVQGAMRAEGVDFVGDAAGLEALLRIVASGRGAVVLGRDLPADQREVRYTEQLSVERQPYLADHAIEGVPVVPLAGVVDIVAHAAGANSPFEVVDLTLYQGIAVRAPTAVHVDVRAGKATVRFGERRTLAYKATVRPAGAVVDPGARVGGAPSALSVEEFYRDITFHGPRFQGIVALDGVAEGFMHGRVRSGVPADFVPDTPRRAWVVDPLAVDSAMQLTAMVAWSRFGRAGTPIGLRRLVQLAPLPAGEVLVEADFGDAEDDRFTATFRLRDPATGALLLVAEDVAAELRKVDEKAPEEPEAFEVKAEWVDPGRWAVVRDLDMRLQLAEASGVRNPYFSVHEGTARNTTVVAGRELVNFSSYNYLGLSGDPRVLDNVKVAIDRYGTSVSASRVASGERPFHQELEAELAECQGAEDSLVFTAGHATNVTAIGHLMGPKDLILHDELIHDSALQGIKLAGSARRSFRHDDPEHLEQQLRALRSSFEKVLIVVEGVYSMDGDICALPTYLELKKKYGALLMVDEAHSFGIIGQRGCGAGEHFGIDGREVDLWMGTLSKSLASCGGWLAGSGPLIRYMRYTAPGFVYSAGITPANGVAALTSLRLMLAEPERVQTLQSNARLFHDALIEHGQDTGPAHGESAVVPVVTGNSLHALMLSQRLLEQGINVQPIVYPAVADDSARLRFFLSSTHTPEQLIWTAKTVADTLANVRADFPLPGR